MGIAIRDQGAASTAPHRARRLLVVDDDPLVRALFAEALQGEGQVDVAADGIDALQQLGDSDYDLILTDLHMPRLDGYGLFEAAITARPELRASFVFTTGATSGGSVLTLYGRALPLLHKPVTMAALTSVVRAHLDALADDPELLPPRALAPATL